MVFRDISERRQLEEALQHANADLEQRVQQRTAALVQTNSALRAEVTERKRVEEKLRESERLAVIGTTTAKLAHEIGNPLNGMYTTLQVLERFAVKQTVPGETPWPRLCEISRPKRTDYAPSCTNSAPSHARTYPTGSPFLWPHWSQTCCSRNILLCREGDSC